MRSLIDICDFTVDEINSLINTAYDIIDNPENYNYVTIDVEIENLSDVDITFKEFQNFRAYIPFIPWWIM